ncbi:MAG TPA: flagellar export protein FliJ [Burkholderiaceae bacterium]
MATRSPIQTLIELSERETDDAAKRLGNAIKAGKAQEEKLDMLLNYRDDYAVRLQNAQMTGLTPMQYRNFQAFLAKLDNAIAGQRDYVANANRRVEAERSGWQAAERKRMSYSTLHDRAKDEALRQENKRDQKAMDEFATRQAFYKR